MSASIINPTLPYLFSDVAAGFVVRPDLATVLCSFPKDGGTMPYTCSGDDPDCLPGCYGGGHQRSTCVNSVKGCYDSNHLQDMLEDQGQMLANRYDRCDRCAQGNGCRYNELVLDAATWVRNLPNTIHAVFFPRGGDAASARKIRKDFVAHFGLPDSAVPLVQLDLTRPDLAFESVVLEDPGLPVKPAHALDSDKCRAVMSDPLSKFWTLWGVKAWEKLPDGAAGCWNGRETFFEDALSDSQCDVNWYEGAKGALGLQNSRPSFTGPAPALLGFDDTIFAFCSLAIGELAGFVKTSRTDDFNEELAQRCVQANENILRLISKRVPWNMCQNLQWQLCAARGKLPGQDGRKVHFATAPNALDMRVWRRPDSWPCDKQGNCPKGKFAVGDVFFAEVCIMDRLCKNGAALFDLEEGEMFECDFDAAAYEELAAEFRRNVPITGGCKDWHDSTWD